MREIAANPPVEAQQNSCEYNVVWEVIENGKIHNENMSYDSLEVIFVYGYGMLIPAELRKTLWSMKKDQSISYDFPGTKDKITVTALKDIEPLPF